MLVAGKPGPGGLVPVLLPVIRRFGGRWLAAPASEGDREVARHNPEGITRPGFTLQLLELPRRAHDDHYQTVSNGCLGLLFHYLFALQTEPVFDRGFERAWRNYRRVNRLYARAVARTPGPGPVLIQDFHLMCAGEELRRVHPRVDRPLLYFHHVPWCDPDYFEILPAPVQTDILRGLLANAVVGFHATRWARAFIECCQRCLRGAECEDDRIRWSGGTTRVVVAPAAIDVPSTRGSARSSGATAWVRRLELARAGRWMLTRIDRADLWKNLYRGFLAFETLLERRPDLAHQIWFAALTTPARPWIPAYRNYFDVCTSLVERINRRFPASGENEGPVSLLVAPADEPGRDRALAAMRIADALLVNPLLDGLNVVAKEWAAVSERNGVLILSRKAGVHEQLERGALSVDPFDVAETASAIERAFAMDASERRERSRILRRIVTAATPERWIEAQLEALP